MFFGEYVECCFWTFEFCCLIRAAVVLNLYPTALNKYLVEKSILFPTEARKSSIPCSFPSQGAYIMHSYIISCSYNFLNFLFYIFYFYLYYYAKQASQVNTRDLNICLHFFAFLSLHFTPRFAQNYFYSSITNWQNPFVIPDTKKRLNIHKMVVLLLLIG